MPFARSTQRHDGKETTMQCGTTKLLTTHTGSLPRPRELVSLLIEEQAGHGTAWTALDAATQGGPDALPTGCGDESGLEPTSGLHPPFPHLSRL
jgi:hypothetical protein